MIQANILQEAKGVPDIDNVTILIDNIIDKIKEKIKTFVYLNAPAGGVQNGTVHEVFPISNIYNPCVWLGNDNVIEYQFIIDKYIQESTCSAIFQELAEGTGEIEPEDKELNVPRVIHGGKILLVMKVGGDVTLRFTNPVHNYLNKIKVALRHEIGHVYEELYLHKIFRSPEYTNTNKLISDKEYMRACSYVGFLLNKNDSFDSEEEKSLFKVLYTTSYIEINAHVCGFYQRVTNSITGNETIPSLSSYYEYKIYSNNIDFLNKFNNKELFNKHKELIISIFGNGIKTIVIFKKRLIDKCQKALQKMEKCYDYVIEHKSITGKLTLEAAENFYNSYVNLIDKRFYESANTMDRLYNTTAASIATRGNIEGFVNSVDYIFSNKTK